MTSVAKRKLPINHSHNVAFTLSENNDSEPPKTYQEAGNNFANSTLLNPTSKRLYQIPPQDDKKH